MVICNLYAKLRSLSCGYRNSSIPHDCVSFYARGEIMNDMNVMKPRDLFMLMISAGGEFARGGCVLHSGSLE